MLPTITHKRKPIGRINQITDSSGATCHYLRMMECKMLFLTLFAVLPSLWAFPTGAPVDACGNLMPQHTGAQRMPNNGFIIMSDVIDNESYEPGETYEGN